MISVNIICKDEEKNVEDCLKSVLWADEIIVVDGESKDKTAVIASKYTKNVYVNKWEGFAKQRQFALSKSTKEWVLVLDADERCSNELREEILSIINNRDNKYNGYKLPRKNFFLTIWIKHGGWYPGYQKRFFRRERTSISERLVHEGYEIDGEVGVLKGDILHYTVQSISEFMAKVNQYSTLQAEEKIGREKTGYTDMILRPLRRFINIYFIRGGFRDGIPGLMVANFDLITTLLTYMKIWESQNKNGSK
ncbi:MAG: glycosyltransferase family 2 protein [Ignavibacteria bacterium]